VKRRTVSGTTNNEQLDVKILAPKLANSETRQLFENQTNHALHANAARITIQYESPKLTAHIPPLWKLSGRGSCPTSTPTRREPDASHLH
jgi:hypothetical protein